MQAGRPEAALPFYEAAFTADPAQGQFWLSYANALLGVGRIDTAVELLAEGRRRGLAGPTVEALSARAERLRQAMQTFASGVAHHQAGEFANAIARYKAALDLQPDHADAASNLGIAQQSLGLSNEAEASCRRAIALKPAHVGAHFNLGSILQSLGRPADAAASFTRTLELQPGYAQAYGGLGNALRALGRLPEAEAAYRRAVELAPDDVGAHVDLGDALRATGQLAAAEASYRRADALAPEQATVSNNLGLILYELGKAGEAETVLRRAIARDPNTAALHRNLGAVLRSVGRLADAEAAFARALAIQPDYAEAQNDRGVTLRDLGRLDEAERELQLLAARKPDDVGAQSNLGHVLREMGKIEDAVDVFEWIVSKNPVDPDAHKSLLLTLTYHPALDPETVFAAHRRFEDAVAKPLYAHAQPLGNIPDPGRRLRIGYLSSDLRSHSAAHNLLPLFAAHDRTAFEIHLYAEVAKPDSVTDSFRAIADGWRSTVGLGDGEVGAMMRADKIDILVCLAGRFDQNRPLVGARKPAPIQISSHDVATSGMTAFDYLFSDRILTPRNTEEKFAERLLCLPSFVLSRIPVGAPTTQLRHGPIVFGCFNNPAKISDPVLDLWARLLARVPDARLLLRFMNLYESVSIRARVFKALDAHGIDRTRVSFPVVAPSYLQHLQIYNEIDIALDTFPFSGSTTTFDALLMGVPVVTFARWSMVSRWSASMLARVDLADLVADSPEAYLDIALRLASDRPRLAMLRTGLRDRVAQSSLCDAPRKARQIERFYRAVWKRWCRDRDRGRTGESGL